MLFAVGETDAESRKRRAVSCTTTLSEMLFISSPSNVVVVGRVMHKFFTSFPDLGLIRHSALVPVYPEVCTIFAFSTFQFLFMVYFAYSTNVTSMPSTKSGRRSGLWYFIAPIPRTNARRTVCD